MSFQLPLGTSLPPNHFPQEPITPCPRAEGSGSSVLTGLNSPLELTTPWGALVNPAPCPPGAPSLPPAQPTSLSAQPRPAHPFPLPNSPVPPTPASSNRGGWTSAGEAEGGAALPSASSL